MTNFSIKKTLSILFLFLSLYLFDFQNVIALDIIETESVSVSAIVGGIVIPTPGGGGGGGVVNLTPVTIPETATRFSGLAYPFAPVTISKQGVEVITVTSDSNGYFTATLTEEYNETILYSVIARDILGNRSLLLNYPIAVRTGYLTHLSGILFAPTVVLDKRETTLNGDITISGYALPDRDVDIIINGDEKKAFERKTNSDGTYKYILNLSGLPKGEYTISIKYKGDERQSKLVKFVIGDKVLLNEDLLETLPGDCNTDGVINLIDFSVLAFWYKKPNPPICVDVKRDNIVDLIDFSILAYFWTG